MTVFNEFHSFYNIWTSNFHLSVTQHISYARLLLRLPSESRLHTMRRCNAELCTMLVEAIVTVITLFYIVGGIVLFGLRLTYLHQTSLSPTRKAQRLRTLGNVSFGYYVWYRNQPTIDRKFLNCLYCDP